MEKIYFSFRVSLAKAVMSFPPSKAALFTSHIEIRAGSLLALIGAIQSQLPGFFRSMNHRLETSKPDDRYRSKEKMIAESGDTLYKMI